MHRNRIRRLKAISTFMKNSVKNIRVLFQACSNKERACPRRSVFAVTAQRCSEVFDPPASVTLWHLPEALQDEFEFQWEFWLDDAPSWEPFFLDIEAIGRGSLLDALRKFQMLPDEVFEALSRIKRPSEGRAVQSAQIFEPDHFHLALWALRASATNTRFTAHPARYWQAHRLDAQIWAGFRVSANTNKITSWVDGGLG